MDKIIALRNEIHKIIDSMPEHNLYRLRPLLDALVDTDKFLSFEEEQLLEQSSKGRRKDPESFSLLAEVGKSL
ncbi:MAG: hypothetical protein LBB43_01780 [Spirochaetaceae bacterium]|jgi:hypothetical protein|nr:hypothetical protein [Spirochaetaceae bacterium]